MKNKHHVNVHLSEADEVVVENSPTQAVLSRPSSRWSKLFFFVGIVWLIIATVWLLTQPNTFRHDVSAVLNKTTHQLTDIWDKTVRSLSPDEPAFEPFEATLGASLSVLENTLHSRVTATDHHQQLRADQLKGEITQLNKRLGQLALELEQLKIKQKASQQSILKWKDDQRLRTASAQSLQKQIEANYQSYQNQSAANVLAVLNDQVMMAINAQQYEAVLRQLNALKAWLAIFPDLKKKYSGLMPAIDHDIKLAERLSAQNNWPRLQQVVKQLLNDAQLFGKSPTAFKQFLGGLVTISSADQQTDGTLSDRWELKQLLNRLLYAIELEQIALYKNTADQLFTFLRHSPIDERYDPLVSVLKASVNQKINWLLPTVNF